MPRPRCILCGDIYSTERAKAGYDLCMPCGEAASKKVRHTIAPLNKSNYMVFTDLNMLKQLNPKRT